MIKLNDDPQILRTANFGDVYEITELETGAVFPCEFMQFPNLHVKGDGGIPGNPGIESVNLFYLNVQVPSEFTKRHHPDYSVVHVRQNRVIGGTEVCLAVFTRSELIEMIASNQYVIC